MFLKGCQRVLLELEMAKQKMSAMTQSPWGRLRVGLSYAAWVSLPVIANFMARYPDIELNLDFSNRTTDVIDEGLDVVIRGGRPSDPVSFHGDSDRSASGWWRFPFTWREG